MQHSVAISKGLSFVSPGNKFKCIFLDSPGDEEIRKVCAEFNIEERYFHKYPADYRSVRYSFDPLIFSFNDYSVGLDNNIEISHLLFVVRRDLLVVAVAEKRRYYKKLFEDIVARLHRNGIKSTTHILYDFLHRDTRENYDVLERMDDRINQLEDRILHGAGRDKEVMNEIVSIKKYLTAMNKRLWASSKIIFTIKKDLTSIKLTKEEQALLEDIYDTLLHQIDLIETQKETVTDFFEIFTTHISNRLAETSNELNIVMKKMAALTIILMIPTLIAGIYGMNFHLIPELSWPSGYFFALSLMVLSVLAAYIIFHRKGWV